MRRQINSWISLLLLVLAMGCGGAAPPTQQMVTAEAALRGAKELGAQDVPRAALAVKHAEKQIDQAKLLMNEGNNEEAALKLKGALADAELAISLARETEAEREAKEAMDMVVKVQEESQLGKK